MKNNIFVISSALTIALAVFSKDSFSQRNGYPHGYPNQPQPQQQAPVAYGQWQRPNAPFVIVDGNGDRNGYQGRNFDQCFEQRSLSRKQRRKLEKRFGFVPPVVMFVPDRYVTRNGRGDVYVYNNGFTYHRERDGYFHLDDRFFNNDWDNKNDRGDWDYGRNRN